MESDENKEGTTSAPFSAPDDGILTIERAIRDAMVSWKSVDIDVDETIAEWAAHEIKRLPRAGARNDFNELCKARCHPSVLGLLLALIRKEPGLSNTWNTIVGPLGKGRPTTIFSKAAAGLDTLFEGMLTVVRPDSDSTERTNIPGSLAAAIAADPVRAVDTWFTVCGRLPLRQLVSELRFYDQLAAQIAELPTEIGARSLEQALKYLLTTYVRRTTGREHDRNVSGLIAEVQGTPYDETNHRMWRHRNIEKLEPKLGGALRLPDILIALGRALKPRNELFHQV